MPENEPMPEGVSSLVYAVIALLIGVCVVKWIGEWINGGWHWTRHRLRKIRHRWDHRNCRKPKPPTK